MANGPKASKKDAPNARERRASARAAEGISTPPAASGSFLVLDEVRGAIEKVVAEDFKLVLEKVVSVIN